MGRLEFAVLYIYFGIALAFLQKEPENPTREEKSLFIFFLLFIIATWPLYVIIRILDRGK